MPLEKPTREKIAALCDITQAEVIDVYNVPSTYLVPALLKDQGLLQSISKILCLSPSEESIEHGTVMWRNWKALTESRNDSSKSVTIALVGKYTGFMDSYISVLKSLEHSGMALQHKINRIDVDTSDLEEQTLEVSKEKYEQAWAKIRGADGILVPGGFGERGTEGMIAAARWARENKTPYLGICLGMQMAVVEFARHVCGISQAGSIELSPECANPVIIFMPEIDRANMGGTMRLGSRSTVFQDGSDWSKLRKHYGGERIISERHRHRYEVNPEYVESLSEAGLHFIGKDEENVRMEIIELKDHPWYVGVQFHPEYLSRVLQPSKPYLGFISAAIANQKPTNEAANVV